MAAHYLWIKAFHVIAVIAWYAGLFYIFRLYVYHVQKRDEPAVTATLEVMERRLLRGIMMRNILVRRLRGWVVKLLLKVPGVPRMAVETITEDRVA